MLSVGPWIKGQDARRGMVRPRRVERADPYPLVEADSSSMNPARLCLFHFFNSGDMLRNISRRSPISDFDLSMDRYMLKLYSCSAFAL